MQYILYVVLLHVLKLSMPWLLLIIIAYSRGTKVEKC